MRCSAAVETLVRHAGWSGDVYIIYENDGCFDAEKIKRESGIAAERLHLIHYNTTSRIALRGTKSSDAGATERIEQSESFIDPMMEHLSIPDAIDEWRIKSRVFNIIKDQKIKIVASVSCDSLFAIEGCAANLISNGVDWKSTDESIKFTSLESGQVGNITDVK